MEEARQIKVGKSETTTAEEEAEMVMKDEKKEGIDSTEPLQPKSDRLAPDSILRRRPVFKEKVSRALSKVKFDEAEAALKVAVEIPDLSLKIGHEADADCLGTSLWKEVNKEDKPPLFKEKKDPMSRHPDPSSVPHHPVGVHNVGTAKLNGGMEMEMDREANTHRNHGSGNAELSSCTSKTTKWALLITSLLLEAISAIFEQLGYALVGMVMAFLALLLSIIDLIHKARKEGIKGDGRSLLPSFSRHLSHDSRNRKPFGSLVEYFGLAGAVWQCSYSTIQYYYTRQNLNNPIKICLLPFIFALCVAISKLVKSSPNEPSAEP